MSAQTLSANTDPSIYNYTFSCGGTRTQNTGHSWDDFPEHHALHQTVRDLQRQLNALKDLMAREGGWWLRLRLIRYLRTR